MPALQSCHASWSPSSRRLTAAFKAGKSRRSMFHARGRSTPKQLWMNPSRAPAMSFLEVSGLRRRMPCGSRSVASQ